MYTSKFKIHHVTYITIHLNIVEIFKTSKRNENPNYNALE